jgi:hypothetical protein
LFYRFMKNNIRNRHSGLENSNNINLRSNYKTAKNQQQNVLCFGCVLCFSILPSLSLFISSPRSRRALLNSLNSPHKLWVALSLLSNEKKKKEFTRFLIHFSRNFLISQFFFFSSSLIFFFTLISSFKSLSLF